MRATTLTKTLALAALTSLTLADDATTAVGYFAPKDSFQDDASTTIAVPTYASTAASIVSVNALETTLAIACLDDAPTSICSIKDPWTMIQGISTYSLSAQYTALEWNPPVTATLDYKCDFENYSESASCTYSMSYSGSESGVERTSSYSSAVSIPTEDATYYRMLVTGGVDKLSEPEATETPGAAAGFAGPVQAMVTAAPMIAAGVVALL
ncbi:hypothetical protein BDV19DRAFT_372591 [Aspergillus venezuelensis]